MHLQGDVLLWHKENGLETLDAVQYIELLEGEVKRLRQQLDHPQQQPEQPKLPQSTAATQQQQPVVPQVAPAALQTSSRQLPVPLSTAQHALQVSMVLRPLLYSLEQMWHGCCSPLASSMRWQAAAARSTAAQCVHSNSRH